MGEIWEIFREILGENEWSELREVSLIIKGIRIDWYLGRWMMVKIVVGEKFIVELAWEFFNGGLAAVFRRPKLRGRFKSWPRSAAINREQELDPQKNSQASR